MAAAPSHRGATPGKAGQRQHHRTLPSPGISQVTQLLGSARRPVLRIRPLCRAVRLPVSAHRRSVQAIRRGCTTSRFGVPARRQPVLFRRRACPVRRRVCPPDPGFRASVPVRLSRRGCATSRFRVSAPRRLALFLRQPVVFRRRACLVPRLRVSVRRRALRVFPGIQGLPVASRVVIPVLAIPIPAARFRVSVRRRALRVFPGIQGLPVASRRAVIPALATQIPDTQLKASAPPSRPDTVATRQGRAFRRSQRGPGGFVPG